MNLFVLFSSKYHSVQIDIVNRVTVPKFEISQSEAESTVLISYDIKSLIWTLNFGLNLGMVNA